MLNLNETPTHDAKNMSHDRIMVRELDDDSYQKSILDCLQQLSHVQQASNREIIEMLKAR